MNSNDVTGIGTWALEHGVSGVLFLSNALWIYLYLRERGITNKTFQELQKSQKERLTAEQANSAALIRVHSEVGKTVSTLGKMVDFLDKNTERFSS